MNLIEELNLLLTEATSDIAKAISEEDLDLRKNNYIGKKGKLTEVLKQLGSFSVEEKQTIGKRANEIRNLIDDEVSNKRKLLKEEFYNNTLKTEFFDSLRPEKPLPAGSLHPVTKILYEIEDIFLSMGFSIMDGPEVETDENNFAALNFTEDHPARDMQDTFYVEDGHLLRTHTSAIQARALRELQPPFKIIAPGRVFRYEEVDASHENTFYQIEGMVIGENISAANLIYMMSVLLKEIFKKEVVTRLRPGYFPFVEPGFELDFECMVCHGKGCPVCKQSGWVEILPCGLVHPNVLQSAGLDPKKWSGFAFGLGLDRLVMMRYGINDIRNIHSGNLRFLQQFK